jgi:hypothetical protein
VIALEPGERERVAAARVFVHKATCPPPGSRFEESCAACPSPAGTLMALRLLDQSPRDARGARRALHDVACLSGCGPDSDHADRTQSRPAAALRKFHAAQARGDL